MTVKTENGLRVLAIRTGWPGTELAQRWVLLTYAKHSGVAIQVRVLDK